MSTAAWPFYMELMINSVEQGHLCDAEDACYAAVREAAARDMQGRRLAISLQALAAVTAHRGRYLSAQRHYYRAWTILKSACGESSPETATALAQIGWACLMQQKYDEAEPLFTEALPILEQNRDGDRAWLIKCIHGLGDIHLAARRRVAALLSYQRALSLLEKADNSQAPLLVATLNKLGDYYLVDARYQDAEPLYWRANKIAVAAMGADSAAAACTMQKVAELYRRKNEFPQAEDLLVRAQPMLVKGLGPEHPEVARHLGCLARLHCDQARYKDAAALLERAVGLLETAVGGQHPEIAELLELRAHALDISHQPKLAREMRERAAEIREKLSAEEENAEV